MLPSSAIKMLDFINESYVLSKDCIVVKTVLSRIVKPLYSTFFFLCGNTYKTKRNSISVTLIYSYTHSTFHVHDSNISLHGNFNLFFLNYLLLLRFFNFKQYVVSRCGSIFIE